MRYANKNTPTKALQNSIQILEDQLTSTGEVGTIPLQNDWQSLYGTFTEGTFFLWLACSLKLETDAR